MRLVTSSTKTLKSHRVRVAVLMNALLLGACGGGGGSSNTPPPPPPPPPALTYTVGGTITGLTGTGLVLLNNGTNALAITANGAFTFSAALQSNATYNVTVQTQPSSPTQSCIVSNGSGTVSNANVTNVAVSCITMMSVTSTTPADNASNVARTAQPTIQFSAPINPATVTSANITLSSAAGSKPVMFSTSGNQVTVQPVGRLLPLTSHTLTITAGVRGSTGEVLPSAVSRTFTTRDGVWATAALIETDNAGPAGSPQIAFGANGDAIAVWQQSDGTRFNIWANRFTAGAGWGTAALIETDNAGDASSPQVAVDPSGNAIAVWQQLDGSQINIWANRFTAGAGWGTAALIETAAGPAFGAQIALDAQGSAIAVWHQHDGTRYSIWANRFTVGGGWGIPALIETDNAGDALSPQIAIDPSGHAIAVWSQIDGTLSNLWANRYVPGSGWSTATLIETDNAGSADLAKIAVNQSGNALAVWQQSDGTRNNIWANRYAPGTGWGTATLIENDNAGTAAIADIAIDLSGNGLAVWHQSDGTRFNIWANRFTVGSGWGVPTLLESDNAGHAVVSQIAFDPSGNALSVWRQSDGMRNNVWANRYVLGVGWGTATLIESDDAGNAGGPQIAIDSNGSATAVWEQSDGTRNNIWANRFE